MRKSKDGSPGSGTIGWFIRHMLDKNGISVDEFCRHYGQYYGLTRTTLYNWRNNQVRETDIPLNLIQAFADLERTSIADICLTLGIDVNAKGKHVEMVDNVSQYRIAPFKQNVGNIDYFNRTIVKAIEFRRKFVQDGTLATAQTLLEYAIDFSRKARASSLTAYLQTYLSDIYRMEGDLSGAINLAERTIEVGQRLYNEGKRHRDDVQTKLGARIIANARIRQLSARFLASGVTRASLIAGENLIEELDKLHVEERIPGVYEILARIALGMGYLRDARYYISHARNGTFALTNPNYRHFELFLDAGGSLPTGEIDYVWSEDHIRSTEADILIALDELDDAWSVYQKITHHKPPRSHLSPLNWFDPRWVNFIQAQAAFTMIDDVKLSYSFEDWLLESEESGQPRLQASHLYNWAQYEANHNNTSLAIEKLERAQEVAMTFQAKDIAIESLASKYILGKRPVDRREVNMLETNLHGFDNPRIQAKCELALRSITQ